MRYAPPNARELVELGKHVDINLSRDDAETFAQQAAGLAFAYDRVDAMFEWVPPVRYPREAGWQPAPDENPFGAWRVRCAIKGAADGPLAGKRVAIKDTVAVAGLPLTNGSDVLAGHVADCDATVVERILDAGGEIAGKAVCEYFSYSSGSHTAVTGMVENPVKRGHSSGGSSSGCAALVASGAVDMAIGGDQAGSIRIPAAHCGIYGLKPTWGLVPYTGAMSSEFVIDHLGPMAANLDDCAVLLEAIAGPDPLDPRTSGARPPHRYCQALGQPLAGLRIGLVEEGFGHRNSLPAVDDCVRRAAQRFADLGASVETISIPWHRDGLAVWLVFAMEGYHDNLMRSNGQGGNQDGFYRAATNDAVARWRDRADALPPNLKFGMLMGEHATRRYRRHYYAKARNLAGLLRRAYDAALSRVDVLLMPTVPYCARPLPRADATATEVIGRAFENIDNTCPFNLSHHPALSVPCGSVDVRPIGMMLVGRPFEETTLFRAAAGFARAVDWRDVRIPAHEAEE